MPRPGDVVHLHRPYSRKLALLADASTLWVQREPRSVRVRLRLHLHAGLWRRATRARLADDGDAGFAARLGNLRCLPAITDRLFRPDLGSWRRQPLSR